MEETKTNEDEEKKIDEEVIEVINSKDDYIKKLIATYPILEKIVEPHDKKSRLVTEGDVENVAKLAQTLYDICMIGAYAMAHPQIENNDPMRFFVTNQREIIINPTITRHSNYFSDSRESCMTFLGKEQIIIKRWQKMEVTYQTIMIDPEDSTKFKLSSLIEESLTGKKSFIWQHEIQHLQGGKEQYIYEF